MMIHVMLRMFRRHSEDWLELELGIFLLCFYHFIWNIGTCNNLWLISFGFSVALNINLNFPTFWE